MVGRDDRLYHRVNERQTLGNHMHALKFLLHYFIQKIWCYVLLEAKIFVLHLIHNDYKLQAITIDSLLHRFSSTDVSDHILAGPNLDDYFST